MRKDRILRINKTYAKCVTAPQITLTIEMASNQKKEILYKWGEKLRPRSKNKIKESVIKMIEK